MAGFEVSFQASLLHAEDDPDALQETLVVRPQEDSLLRTAVRIARSRACAAVVVDAAGFDDVSGLVLGLRRLTLAAEDSKTAVLLVTSLTARRRQPLPVAARADVVVDDGETAILPVRHRYGMPPRLTISKARLRPSVIADLVAEQRQPTTSSLSLVAHGEDLPVATSLDDRLRVIP